MPAHLHTTNLYKFDDVVSALQKSIRRCDVEQALFWAGELEEGFVYILYSRLWVMVAEDIGLAEPFLALDLYVLYQEWLKIHKMDSVKAQQLTIRFVYALAKAPKNRIVDNLILFNYFQPKPSATWKARLPEASLQDKIQHLFAVNLFATAETKEIDVQAALLQFAACLEQSDASNAFYFCNLINFSKEENTHTPWLLQYLGLNKTTTKVESKIAKKMLGHCWYVLLEISKDQKELFEVLKVLYRLYIAKTGSALLSISLAILLCCHRDKLDYKTIEIPSLDTIPQPLQQLYYNNAFDILKRRRYPIPNYAIDKHTDRGKGSDFAPHNIADLHTEAQKKKIPTYQWTEADIAKSHGAYKKFEAFVNGKKHSRMSHFFYEGAKLSQVPEDWKGADPYSEQIIRLYLSLEKKYGWKACSGFFIEEKMLPLWIKSQDLWR